MNNRNRFVLGAALLVGLSLAGLAGCGGDDLECGERTIAEDGSCVPNTSEIRSCGEGTEVNADGECVLATGGCGPNAAFDSERGRCIPTSDSCSDGTEFDGESGTCVGVTGCGDNTVQNDDGTCVPDVGTLCADQPGVRYNPDSGNCTVGAASCGPGTQLSAESGTCVISDAACDQGLTINDDGNCVPTDEVCGDQSTLAEVDGGQICVPSATCQEDDVVLMPAQSGQGVCVEPAKKLANNPDRTESEEPDNSTELNNDVDNGGNPDTIPVKPVGETTAVVGTIGPPTDVNGDDELEQDQDTFTFEGQAGQWFFVSVQSLGLPHGWFQVFGPNGFEREAQLGLQRNPARQIVLPYDGEYEIEVMTAENAFDTNGDVGPAGDSSWGYVLGLEQLDAPDPASVDFSSNNATGDLPTLTDNAYRMTGFSDGDIVELTLDSLGSGAQNTAVVSIWADPSTPLFAREVSSGDTVPFGYTLNQDGNPPIVHVDWKYAVGPELDYEISAEVTSDVENLGTLTADSTTTSTPRTISEDPEETYNYKVDVQGSNQVIRLTHTNGNDEEAEIDVNEFGGSQIASFNFYDVRNDSFFDADEGYFYVDQPTELLISVTPDSFDDLTDFELKLDSMTPNQTVSNLQQGDRLLEDVDSSADPITTEWHSFSTTGQVEIDGFVEKLLPSGSNPDFEVVVYSATESRELDSGDIFEAGNSGTTADITDEVDFIDRVIPASTYLIGIRMQESPALDKYRIDFSLPGVLSDEEPNGTLGNATDIPVNTQGIGTVTGNDTDNFSVNLQSSLGANEVLHFDVDSTGSDINDWRCNALDTSGSIIAEYGRHESNGDGGDEGCNVFLQGPQPAGRYLFQINFLDSSETVKYTFSVNRVDGIFESEPNDDRTNNATSLSISDFSSGVDIYGNALTDVSSSDVDYFELTNSGSTPSEFDVSCGQIGPDINTSFCFFGSCFGGHSYNLLDQAGNELDSSEGIEENVVLSTGTLSSGDLPLYIEAEADSGSTNDNYYKCEYQTP